MESNVKGWIGYAIIFIIIIGGTASLPHVIKSSSNPIAITGITGPSDSYYNSSTQTLVVNITSSTSSVYANVNFSSTITPLTLSIVPGSFQFSNSTIVSVAKPYNTSINFAAKSIPVHLLLNSAVISNNNFTNTTVELDLYASHYGAIATIMLEKVS
ncbi:hypothetical protein OXIME_000379 [Oxyplasma meridianum]|uniref:DUF4382 domain-containing protein n=1 Tax=Oxyplasma meridianum TaxID=3073602 RepID=A0AAX4NEH3_9ARCH